MPWEVTSSAARARSSMSRIEREAWEEMPRNERKNAKLFLRDLCLGMLVFLAGAAAGVQAAPASRVILLATTTSTQDSGLLDLILPAFEKESGLFVKTLAVGSGQAMALGRRGEVDVLLVHSPEAEKGFMAEGYGSERRIVMYNGFVLVGPPGDPAGIGKATDIREAFQRIAAKGALFLSRGDNSGTHAKEAGLWKKAGINPEGRRFYQQTGLGMGQTLAVASEKGGYTLTDRGTYLALRRNLDLAVLSKQDRGLLNVYHVISVSPAKWPKVNAAGVKAFCDFMVSARGQALIRDFGRQRFGEPLFFPAAGRTDLD